MLNREDKKFLRGVFSKYDYIMTTSQLKEEKLFYRDIQKLLNDGYIEKIKRGYYAWVEATTITILPIVETRGGDITGYISTNIISITDGQLVLSRKNFEAGQKPAINYGLSVSRLGGAVQDGEMKKLGARVRREF